MESSCPLGQYSAILTSHLVNNPYIMTHQSVLETVFSHLKSNVRAENEGEGEEDVLIQGVAEDCLMGMARGIEKGGRGG